MLPQVGRVGVVPAEVALVDRLDVVANRAVVAAGMPGMVQIWWQLHHLGDFAVDVALVDQPQGLVVQVGVHVPLLGQVGDDLWGAPGGPVMRGERHIRLVGEQLDRLGQVAGPDPRVADLRAAQGQQVVQVVRGVLGHAQRPLVREVEVHLCGSFGAGGHLEHDPDPVQDFLLAGTGDVQGRCDQAGRAGRSPAPSPIPRVPVAPLGTPTAA